MASPISGPDSPNDRSVGQLGPLPVKRQLKRGVYVVDCEACFQVERELRESPGLGESEQLLLTSKCLTRLGWQSLLPASKLPRFGS